MDAKVIGRILGVVVLVGFFLAITDEALRVYRGWTNKDGTAVGGYGLYEKEITSKRLSEMMPDVFRNRRTGWELVEFHQYQFWCKWQMGFKQRTWEKERERKLKVKMSAAEDSPNLYTEDELPVVRYACAPMKMLYQAGRGWGLF